MKLVKYLANLGYGTRREVQQLVRDARVTNRDGRPLNEGDAFDHGSVLVDDEPLDVPPGSVVMLHKPTGYVCSTNEATQLIYELLPERFRSRTPVIAPVGRLDRDTSGLLLLTDDGQLNHRMTSPRSHVPKVYEVELASPLRGDEQALFERGGLMLESETVPLKPVTMQVHDATHVRLTLTEGRYHQVRRMFAAVGNHVQTLHRVGVGALELGELEEGRWRALSREEAGKLMATP